jgi:hypothetical protein
LVARLGTKSRSPRRTPTTTTRRVEKSSESWRSGVLSAAQAPSSVSPMSCAAPSRKPSMS